MNLLEILRSRVDNLTDGEYLPGLKAIIQHIEVASRHLERGQADADDTAFTDAIYRTNQAFEGSLKEAFRVLTAKDPSRERPNSIEDYLQQYRILRPRVMAQLSNYRREWRNPSTHDYRLDFDEDEALLAIVTVSAFAIVLVDQIMERISYEQAKTVAAEQPTSLPVVDSLLERVSSLIEQFTIQFNKTHQDKIDIREVEIIGALAGFLETAAPELVTKVEGVLSEKAHVRADLLIKSGDEHLILEVKRVKRLSLPIRMDAIEQVDRYMHISGINQAILLIFSSPNSGKVTRKEESSQLEGNRLVVISTK